MTTKSLILFLLLCTGIQLQAQQQECAKKNANNQSIAFESVSFATEHGDVIITCENADDLTDFQISGEDANLDFGWQASAPANHFPMKLGIKPGDVTIRYTMKGQKPKIIRLKLVAKEEVKVAI